MAAKIRKGDTVIVIAGKDKGKTGEVLKVIESGKRFVVEGINMIKKHMKPNPQLQQEGGIVSKEATIHSSNVLILNPVSKKGDRVKFSFIDLDGKTKKVRCFVSDGEMIDV